MIAFSDDDPSLDFKLLVERVGARGPCVSFAVMRYLSLVACP